MEKEIQSEIEQVMKDCRDRIESIMRKYVQGSLFGGVSSTPVRRTPRASVPRALPAAPTAVRKSAGAPRVYPPHCLAEGCKKVHSGPRSSFLCGDHIHALTKAQKRDLLDAWKSSRKQAA
jgi:hypothetical protein